MNVDSVIIKEFQDYGFEAFELTTYTLILIDEMKSREMELTVAGGDDYPR